MAGRWFWLLAVAVGVGEPIMMELILDMLDMLAEVDHNPQERLEVLAGTLHQPRLAGPVVVAEELGIQQVVKAVLAVLFPYQEVPGVLVALTTP
jgi:hypothetical protein